MFKGITIALASWDCLGTLAGCGHWMCDWCVCLSCFYHCHFCHETLFSPLQLKPTPSAVSSTVPHLSIDWLSFLRSWVTVFYQSHSKSSSLTRAREKLWLIHLCSPLASFMKAEATMGRVVIKTHTQSKCLIPLKIHNRCLEFDLCISRAQLVLFLLLI